MKKIFLMLIITFCIIACRAQQPIPKIASEKVKVNNTIYKLIKPDNKVTQIININNKLTKVKQIAPNMPSDLKIPGYRKFDKNILLKICAEVIPLTTLQNLPRGYNDYLFMTIKVNAEGEPLEIEFLLKNNSLITPEEIQKIEYKIFESSFKVSFTKGIERYFKGVNYFNIDVMIQYNEMLKAKVGN